MISDKNTIGIIGAGELGSQLAIQIGSFAENVIVYDPNVHNLLKVKHGVDTSLTEANMVNPIKWANDLKQVMDASTIVHLCAPLIAVDSIRELQPNQTLVLHSSTMTRSLDAKADFRSRDLNTGFIGIVHLLMNKDLTVAVSQDSDDVELIDQHIIDINLNPIKISTEQHDRYMAISQAPMAILHKLISNDLEKLKTKGLLTPSGIELNDALAERASRWTPETLHDIFQNPYLLDFVEDMRHQLVRSYSEQLTKKV